MRPREAALAAAEAATGKTGTCAVCGREISLTHNGRRMWAHQRTIVHREADEHGPEIATTVECRGSRRPPVEYAKAYRAARGRDDGRPR
jgi:hypothetical protein